MGYIKDLEHELREMLTELSPEEADSVVKFVKEKVYDSYKNGKAAVKPEGKEPVSAS